MLVKRLHDAALDLYTQERRVHVPVAKHDLRAIVEDWRRLDSAYRSERLEVISLKAEIESLRKDADRYRKLQALQPGEFTGLFIAQQRMMFGKPYYFGPLFGSALDKEVDAIKGPANEQA